MACGRYFFSIQVITHVEIYSNIYIWINIQICFEHLSLVNSMKTEEKKDKQMAMY